MTDRDMFNSEMSQLQDFPVYILPLDYHDYELGLTEQSCFDRRQCEELYHYASAMPANLRVIKSINSYQRLMCCDGVPFNNYQKGG